MFELDGELRFSLGDEEAVGFFSPENLDAVSRLEVGERVTVREGCADFEVARLS